MKPGKEDPIITRTLPDGTKVKCFTGARLWIRLDKACKLRRFKKPLCMPTVEQCKRWMMSISGTGRFDRVWNFATRRDTTRTYSKYPGLCPHRLVVPCTRYNSPSLGDLEVICEMIREFLPPDAVVLDSDKRMDTKGGVK